MPFAHLLGRGAQNPPLIRKKEIVFVANNMSMFDRQQLERQVEGTTCFPVILDQAEPSP